MLSNLKNKIKALKIKRKINFNRKYWLYHQKGRRKAKKNNWYSDLNFFTFERNYRLIKLFSSTIK